MIPYTTLIDEMLIGESPKEKYENLVWIYSLLGRIAYPKRGSIDEFARIYDYAVEIQDRVSMEQLVCD